ncbi:cation-transporting P-type ATPase [Candidatus Woesearchaeota archaeon]|nr:cation-transporting P-type ATPase [Candidatus Woesearchaeota archaeon]
MAEAYYRQTTAEVFATFHTSPDGLSSAEAAKRLQEYGSNSLQKDKKFKLLPLFIDQFSNALSLLLLGAAILALILGERLEAIGMFAILLINAFLGFFQEAHAEKILESLAKITALHAKVMRDGKEITIPTANLVPGDFIILEAGSIVPADARLLEAVALEINEASLTGESMPSAKDPQTMKKEVLITEQSNMVFSGTVVMFGYGKAVVTLTGMKTEFGKIAQSLKEEAQDASPLQQQFQKLARQIGIIAVVMISLVLLIGVMQEIPFFTMLLLALSLAVATIPIALPTVVTIGLSLGSMTLSKCNMLVRKLTAVETLGSTTIICTDKTGTLTKNRMEVRVLYDGRDLEQKSNGFYHKGKVVPPESIEMLARISLLCNNAHKAVEDGKERWEGNATDIALASFAAPFRPKYSTFKRIKEFPFERERKRVSFVYQYGKKKEVYAKGAPEAMLPACTFIRDGKTVRKLTSSERKRILAKTEEYAKNALRVIALAYKTCPAKIPLKAEGMEKDLIFVGLVGLMDPPRDEVPTAIQECYAAGIQVMMITGDHPATAKAIAALINHAVADEEIITGDEIEKMSDDHLLAIIHQIKIIARALPAHKLRVVHALQKKGHVVAMTGDGVNDAPAIRRADVGISMGITGTDVTKQSSHGILLDDNFASIVASVREGRTVYDKMIKSAKYLLSCNVGEIFTILFSLLLFLPLPLLPLQILMINVLTDAIPAVGLALEKSEETVMKKKPRQKNQYPLTRKDVFLLLFFGLVMCVGTLLVFYWNLPNLPKARTIAFTTLVFFQLFAVLSSRSFAPAWMPSKLFSNMWLWGGVCLAIGLHLMVVYTPFFQGVFGTVALSGFELLEVTAVATLGFIIMEASKLFLKDAEPRTIPSS